MSKREEYQISDIADVQTGPFGSQLHMHDYVLKGTPIITVEHFGENKILHNNLPLVSNEDKERLKKYTLKEGDVVFSRVGSVDRRVYVTKQEDGWMFSGRCLRVRSNPNKVNGKFLSYYFGQESFKEYIRMVAVGATMPSINTQILSEASILLPPLPEQERIAEVLSSLDEKIDLLHRNNKTLEQLAETLFRQWLSKLDERESAILGDYIKVQNGYAFKSNDFRDTGNNGVLKITNISFEQVDIYKTQFVDDKVVAGLSGKFLAKPKSFLIAMTGAEIGKVGIIGKTNKKLYINQRVGMLVDILENSSLLGYLYLKSAEGQDHIINTCTGSAQENISSVGIESMIVPKSTPEEVVSFSNSVNPFFEKIISNLEQIQQLETLRDKLLPKLMSGVVRVEN